MQPKTVSISLSRKVNLGNFESIDCQVFMSAEVEEGEDPTGIVVHLGQQAKEAIAELLDKECPQKPFVNTQNYFKNIKVDSEESLDDMPF